MSDTVIFRSVGYAEDADLDINEHGEVENYEELVNAGKTFTEIRAINAQAADSLHESMIVEPGDDEWREKYADFDAGQTEVIIE
jgi:hypothetical protein